MSNDDKLMPCPFCGGTNLEVGRWGDYRLTVACSDCEFDGPEAITPEGAMEKWNGRPAVLPGTVQLPYSLVKRLNHADYAHRKAMVDDDHEAGNRAAGAFDGALDQIYRMASNQVENNPPAGEQPQ